LSRGARLLVLAAFIAYALGWVLPVVDDYRGWQAFRVAFSPVWPFEQFRIAFGPLWVLSVFSAATNLLFLALVALLWVRRWPRSVLYAAAGATLLNLHWPISMGAERSQLQSGYFVWVSAFALLALAAFLQTRPPQH
jgi:hypothetical protein